MKRKPSKDRLVLVEWDDICTDHGWADPGERLGLAKCQSVGFVSIVEKDSITLAGMLGRTGSARENNLRQCIPWGCVTAWKYLPT